MTTPRVPRGTFHRRCTGCGWERTYQTEGHANRGLGMHRCKATTIEPATTEPAPASAPRPVPLAPAPTPAPAPAGAQFVDVRPVRAHLSNLQDAGLTWRRIAERAGVSKTVVHALLNAPRPGARTPLIRRDIATRLFAVRIDDAPHLVDRNDMVGLRRRARALYALGHPPADLAHRFRLTGDELDNLLDSRGRRVSAGTAERIRSTYADLSMTPPDTSTPDLLAAVTEQRAAAIRRRWLVPLNLDENHIDDPDHDHRAGRSSTASRAATDFDEAVVVRRLGGDRTARMRQADRIEIVRRARQLNWSYDHLEMVTGVTRTDRYIDQGKTA